MSVDPINWNTTTAGNITIGQSLKYDNEIWLDGGFAGGGSNTISRSLDAITWTPVSAFSVACNNLAFGGGVWVAVGQDASSYGIQYSEDNGLTWFPAKDGSNNPIATLTQGFAVAYNGTGTIKWVAIGQGFNSAYYSSNGINWTATPLNIFDSLGKDVKFANGIWVATGKDSTGNAIQTSPDGINWTGFQAFGTFTSNEGGRSVTHGLNGNWAVVGDNSDNVNNIYYSNDNGASWNATLAFSGGVGGFGSIAYGNGIFVATAPSSAGNAVYRSTDGTGQTWVSVGLSALGYFVQYSNGRWVVSGSGGVGNNVVYSSNGISWSGERILGGAEVYQVRYGDGKWVATGSTLNTQSVAYSSVAPYVEPPCFLEGSKILTNKSYVPVEQLRAGDKVKTVSHGFVPIHAIGVRPFEHLCREERIKEQLYLCSPKKYPELSEDLVITGCHSTLVPEFESPEQRAETEKTLKGIYITDNHYRLPACVDRRAEVYSKRGEFNVYHFALENDDYYMNYGVYANGLLVETTSKRYLLELSGMKLLE
jgi:hypothetical protein